jgi:hypothetical protein
VSENDRLIRMIGASLRTILSRSGLGLSAFIRAEHHAPLTTAAAPTRRTFEGAVRHGVRVSYAPARIEEPKISCDLIASA